MTTLSSNDIERLVKICGLLGSDHAGERAAAGLKATQLLSECGASWADVIKCDAIANVLARDHKAERRACYPERAGPPDPLDPDRPHQRRARLLLWTSQCPLTQFERDVLATVLSSRSISAKQEAILVRCETKAREWRSRQERAA